MPNSLGILAIIIIIFCQRQAWCQQQKSCHYGDWGECEMAEDGRFVRNRISADPECPAETEICDESLDERFMEDETSRRKRQIASQKKRDILVILDENLSTKEFEQAKKVTGGLIGGLCSPKIEIRNNKTRVSVMTVGSSPTLHVQFRQFYNHAQFKNALGSIRKTAANSDLCLSDGLNYARDIAFSNYFGSRAGQSDTQQDVLIITTGCLKCTRGDNVGILRKAVENLSKKGIRTYVLGVSSSTDCKMNLQVLRKNGVCNHAWYLRSGVDLGILGPFISNYRRCLTQWTRSSLYRC